MCSKGDGKPAKLAEFAPFGSDYKDGIALTTGWVYGQLGGSKRIIVGQLAGRGEVKVFSTGSALQGGPEDELKSPVEHGEPPEYAEDFSFVPFEGQSGVRLATTSTTMGADLLVSGARGDIAKILKFEIAPPDETSSELHAVQTGEVFSGAGSKPLPVGGD
jgi:hypothetical protein